MQGGILPLNYLPKLTVQFTYHRGRGAKRTALGPAHRGSDRGRQTELRLGRVITRQQTVGLTRSDVSIADPMEGQI